MTMHNITRSQQRQCLRFETRVFLSPFPSTFLNAALEYSFKSCKILLSCQKNFVTILSAAGGSNLSLRDYYTPVSIITIQFDTIGI